MKQCSNCINDTTVRKIHFDSNCTCNFCTSYKRIEPKLKDTKHLEELFLERIERVKGKYDYDAVVGISGGKDSMYVLEQLVNKYHLKVKAFTLLNGFFSDEARKNVDSIVKEFGVEHEYIDTDPAFLKRFYHFSMSKWLVPCIACSYMGYASMINYASKMNAGMVVHGRSPEQMLRAYGQDVFTGFVDAGLKSINEIDLKSLYDHLLLSVGDLMDKELMEATQTYLLGDIKDGDYREFVPYFLYHPYNEKEIVNYLQENTSWKVKSKEYNHYDCLIHNAARYIYQCAEGRPHSLPEVATLVRLGEITRKEGKQMIQDAWYKEAPKEEIKKLCDYAGVNRHLLFLKARIYQKFISKK